MGEIGRKGLLPPSQTGLKKEVDTTYVYVLNFLINRQLSRKKEKMVLLFVDLKIAFDLC